MIDHTVRIKWIRKRMKWEIYMFCCHINNNLNYFLNVYFFITEKNIGTWIFLKKLYVVKHFCKITEKRQILLIHLQSFIVESIRSRFSIISSHIFYRLVQDISFYCDIVFECVLIFIKGIGWKVQTSTNKVISVCEKLQWQ